MKKILFVCGGTAGHINPAISVATTIRAMHKDIDIVFAGNPNGMEARLVKKADFPFYPFKAMGIQRQITPQNIVKNIKSVGLLTTAEIRAKKLLREINPDIVVGTGGYVSGPIVMTAEKLNIKTVIHEQNAFPGVTNKLLSKKATRVCLAVGRAREHFPTDREFIITGNPVRPEILLADRNIARRELNIKPNDFCILSFGGSLGAEKVNRAIAEVMKWHNGRDGFHHIHATGRYGTELLPELLDERNVNYKNNTNIDIREYIDNMAQCLAAADVVICRAGAITISELLAVGKAAIIIPSPNVAENHQYHNAKVLVDNNAAIMIEEKNLDADTIVRELSDLKENPERLHRIEQNAKNMAILNANEKIAEIILN